MTELASPGTGLASSDTLLPSSDPARDARPADGRRDRWNAHRTRRRALLVDAGVRAIDAFGPDASAEDIAASAGVSRTVLYRYFRDKEDLRNAVAARVVELLLQELVPPLGIGATAHQIIDGTLEALTAWVAAHPRLYDFLRRRGASGGPDLDDVEATMADQLAELLRVVMAGFGVEAEFAERSAQSLVGMVERTTSWWMRTGRVSRRQLVDHLRNAVWDVISGELGRAGVALDPDDPLPIAAAAPDAFGELPD